WYQGSGYSLDDLACITRGPVAQPSNYPNTSAVASEIVAGVAQDHALEFADTVFAFLAGVTEQQSQQILALNPTLFEAVPNSTTVALRLPAAFHPGITMTMPTGVALAPADAVSALLKYHTSQIIPARLAGLLGVDAELVPALLAMTGADLSTAALVQALK